MKGIGVEYLSRLHPKNDLTGGKYCTPKKGMDTAYGINQITGYTALIGVNVKCCSHAGTLTKVAKNTSIVEWYVDVIIDGGYHLLGYRNARWFTTTEDQFELATRTIKSVSDKLGEPSAY
jgi:hypothetical protein